jgi:hypothetical protein
MRICSNFSKNSPVGQGIGSGVEVNNPERGHQGRADSDRRCRLAYGAILGCLPEGRLADPLFYVRGVLMRPNRRGVDHLQIATLDTASKIPDLQY